MTAVPGPNVGGGAGRHRDGGYALRWNWTERAAIARQPALKEEGKDE